MLPILRVRRQAQKGGGPAGHLQGPPPSRPLPPEPLCSLAFRGKPPSRSVRPDPPSHGHSGWSVLGTYSVPGVWLAVGSRGLSRPLRFASTSANEPSQVAPAQGSLHLHQQSGRRSLLIFTLRISRLATQAPATLASQRAAWVTHSQALPQPADGIRILKDPQHMKV